MDSVWMLQDAYVTKLSPDGASLVYSTYLGGSGISGGMSIRVDTDGFAYVGGYTISEDFPVTPGAFQTIKMYSQNAFITKFSPNGSSLVYSTFVGESSEASAICIDEQGNAYITGNTYSSNFPTTSWVRPSALQGFQAAFLTIVSEDGTSFVASSYIGGNNVSIGSGIATGADDSVYITGYTTSSNFPVTPGAFQTTNHGNNDAFVYRTRFAMYAKSSIAITKL